MANTLFLESTTTTTLHPSKSPFSQSTSFFHPYPLRLPPLPPFPNPKPSHKPFKCTLKPQSTTITLHSHNSNNSNNSQVGLKDSPPNPIGFQRQPTTNTLNSHNSNNSQVGLKDNPPNPIGFQRQPTSNTLNSHNSNISQVGLKDNPPNPIGFVLDAISSALGALKRPAMAAVLVGLLLMSDPNAAWAASGGRVGGRAFSSRTSSSSSRSYSVRPSSPGLSSYSAPYYGPGPFGGGGFYVGPAFGVGVGGLGSSVFLMLMGFAAFVLVSGFLSDRTDDGVLTATEKTSVIKLQVGLLGMARSLQRDLDRIAETADTSTPEGLSYVLTETTLALLRHPDYCISAYSSVDVKRSIEEGEKKFNQLSIEERGKFDEETLVNVNNIKRQSTKSMRSTGFSNEYIVITILVAAEGVHKLPVVNSSLDLKDALQKLASIPSSKIMAVEVLWTPQNENDTLSERELLEDYPLLRPL